jgi:hypothetical protein
MTYHNQGLIHLESTTMTKRKATRATKTKANDPGAKLAMAGKSTTLRTEKGKFAKGVPKPANAGRARGKRNKTTILLKTAILRAGELVGRDGKGLNGLTGYIEMLARKHVPIYSKLLEKVLPMQLNMRDDTEPTRVLTIEEAVAQLQERGLPVPPPLMLLSTREQSAIIAGALNDEHEDGVTDDLDNRVHAKDGLDDLEEPHDED